MVVSAPPHRASGGALRGQLGRESVLRVGSCCCASFLRGMDAPRRATTVRTCPVDASRPRAVAFTWFEGEAECSAESGRGKRRRAVPTRGNAQRPARPLVRCRIAAVVSGPVGPAILAVPGITARMGRGACHLRWSPARTKRRHVDVLEPTTPSGPPSSRVRAGSTVAGSITRFREPPRSAGGRSFPGPARLHCEPLPQPLGGRVVQAPSRSAGRRLGGRRGVRGASAGEDRQQPLRRDGRRGRGSRSRLVREGDLGLARTHRGRGSRRLHGSLTSRRDRARSRPRRRARPRRIPR